MKLILQILLRLLITDIYFLLLYLYALVCNNHLKLGTSWSIFGVARLIFRIEFGT
jgi:hypothetical protein